MNSFKKYLIHRLKETFLLTLVLCIFAVIVMSTFTSLWLGTYFEWIDGYDEPIEVRRLRIEGFGLIAFIIGAACTLMPVVELGDMKNKRNADVIYSLPVSRGKMAIAHYLSGFIQAAAIFTAAYVTFFIKIVTSRLFSHAESPGALIGCYFALLAAGLAVYSIIMAIFNSANTVIDGCVFAAVWSFLICAFVIALCELDINMDGAIGINSISDLRVELLMPHGSFGIADFFNDLVVGRAPDTDHVKSVVMWFIVGIAATAVYYFSFKRKRVEELSDISDTFFGYRVILPISVFSMTQAFDDDLLSYIFAILLGVVGYMIYRRSFKIKRKDIITVGAIVAATLLLIMIFG